MMLLAYSLSSKVSAKAIEINTIVYGKKDDRVLVTSLSNSRMNQKYLEASRSVFAMVTKDKSYDMGFGRTNISAKSVASEFNICKGEYLSEQPSAASCTGFLVAPDTLVTAGHCVRNLKDCQSKMWILDFKFNEKFTKSNISLIVPNDKIYNCKEVVVSKNNYLNDFAVIKLDRKVEGRKPLPLRKTGKVEKIDSLYTIGYPMGIPQTLTRDGEVVGNLMPNYFKLKIDTFMGNSGSPIINERSGEVEGILIKGGADADFSLFGACYDTKICDGLFCNTEEVAQRISTVREFIK